MPDRTPASPFAHRAADLMIGAALVLVPLAFHTGVREFIVFKALVLAVCVGLALVGLALAPFRISRRGLLVLAPALHVLAVLALRPSFDAANQALALLGPMLLAWVAWMRVPAWSARRLLMVLGVPLAVNLSWSLLQGVGIGVLPATAIAFGDTHGVAVGAIGNPNENCWYLVLAGTLVWGLWPRARSRWAWLLLVAVVLVVLIDRSRAAMLAMLVGAGVLFVLRSEGGRAVRLVRLGLGAVLVAAPGIAWGGVEALTGRLYLAQIQLGMLAEQAGLGGGLGSFAADFPAAQSAHLVDHPEHQRFFSVIDHAHNDGFELIYELGALALAWMMALAVMVWRRRNSSDRLVIAALVCLVEGTVLSLFGYPLFSPASAVVLAVALGLVIGHDRLGRDARPAGPLARLLLLGLGLALVVVPARRYEAERAFTDTLQAAHDGEIVDAHHHAKRATAAWPDAESRELERAVTEVLVRP